jgi:PAS domain S-box-containing protein
MAAGNGRPETVTGIDVNPNDRSIVAEISGALFEGINDALVVVDAHGRIVAINGGTERLLGYQREELVGQPVEVLVPEGVRERHVADREQYLANATGRRMGEALGLRAVRKDGGVIAVDVTLSPLSSSLGPLTMCAIRDASERVRVTEALQASEIQFRTLADQATDGIFVTDATGRYVAVNDAACVMFGYTRAQLLQLSIADLIDPSEAGRLAGEIAKLANGAPVKSEWRFRRCDRTTFEGEVNARRLADSRLLAVLRDVSVRKREEDEHRRARRFIEAVAKASPSWIYVFDLDDLSLRYENRSILRDLGHPPGAERLTRLEDFRTFMPEEDQESLDQLIDAWRHLKGDEVRAGEYRVLDGTGATRWFYGRETVFSRHPDGRVHQILGTLDDITAQQQSREALRRSEQRWQFALEGARDGVWEWEPETDAAFYGTRWKEMLGYTDGELGSTRAEWTSRVHPNELADATAAIEAHLSGATPHFAHEHRMRCRDGRWLWVLDRGKVVERASDGRPLRVVGTMTDITPLKLAIEGLQESEERFRTLIQDLDVGVLLQDATDDRILLSNRAAEEMLGIAAPHLDHLSSHTWPWRLLREDGTDYPRDELPSVVAARTGEPVRNQIVGSFNIDSGEGRWLQVSAHPRRQGSDGVRHVLVTMTDVTGRKTAEDALIAAREEWEQSFNALTDWVAVLDREGRVVRANRAMRERFETAPGSLVGRHHSEVYSGEGGSAADPCASVLAGGPPVEFTTTLTNVPGYFVVSCYALAGTGGAVHVVRDITKQRLLEEQLRQSQKMQAIGQLAGGVAHDFNNLLTVISGCTQLALHDLPPQAASVREDIAAIRGAADRAALLTRQLLLFGRKAVWEERIVDLDQLLRHVGQMLKRLISEDVVVTTILSPGLWPTRGDPAQLEQVVLNLALNARDAMPNGGRLTIEARNVHFTDADCANDPVRRPGRFVEMSLRDTGTGMSPDVRAHLFEPFFTTKGPGKGTGLGLSTVYGIVQQAGGFVGVESAIDAGTTFHVFLPAAAEHTADTPAKAEGERGAPGTETVLVVEDERSVRQVIVRLLRSHGYRVLEVGSAVEALGLIERDVGRTIDIVLTDVVMPEVGGQELAQRARELRPDLPVLFISGYNAEHFSRQRPFDAGEQLLQKPFTPQSLTTKLREMLDARR